MKHLKETMQGTGPMIGRCILLLLLIAVPAVAQDAHDHGEAEAEEEHSEGINLSAEELTEFGIVTDTVGAGVIVTRRSLPGEIKPNDDRLAHLVPRYEGIVTAVHAREGDHVRKGQVLAVIESNESLAPYALKTLIDGVVIGKHITLGESASPDRAPYVVADLGTVWVELSVFQRDLPLVKSGQSVRISTGDDSTAATGTISYVTPVVEEHTRTATARVVLENANGHWRPGMFVVGDVELSRTDAAVVIPATALFSIHDHPAVFIRDDHGFEVREVKVGLQDDENIQILSGLEAGETYVRTGGFTLKAEMEKSSFGHGHAH
jgi:membrane fusion protein, heavy metal efflux system